jgi:hypothetical protein
MSKRLRYLDILAATALACGGGAPPAPVLLNVQPFGPPPTAAAGPSIPQPHTPEQNRPSPTEGRTPPPAGMDADSERTAPGLPATPTSR